MTTGPYFQIGTSWSQRLTALQAQWVPTQNGFGTAKLASLQRLFQTGTGPLRVIVNIGAASLLAYLRTGYYATCYERPIIGGQPRGPSAKRLRVDALLGGDATSLRFAALSAGGSGIRFYGEYVLVLSQAAADAEQPQVLDRNSYQLDEEPLQPQAQQWADHLRGTWSERTEIVTLKVMSQLGSQQRLPTAGMIAASVLEDEDYIEVLWSKNFPPTELELVRESVQDLALENAIKDRQRSRELPTVAEIVWAARRRRVREALRGKRVRLVQVLGNGRTGRWS